MTANSWFQILQFLALVLLISIAATILLGIIFPLVVRKISQVVFPRHANDSVLIGQGFPGPAYFHSCKSTPRNGYDAANDNGSQLETINQKLTDRVKGQVATAEADNPGVAVGIELMTASALEIDPHITPAAAEFQLPRVAKERGTSIDRLHPLIAKHTEPQVNVLELNLELDQQFPAHKEQENQ
jgi:K+-transporting ATPase ATPase C chain